VLTDVKSYLGLCGSRLAERCTSIWVTQSFVRSSPLQAIQIFSYLAFSDVTNPAHSLSRNRRKYLLQLSQSSRCKPRQRAFDNLISITRELLVFSIPLKAMSDAHLRFDSQVTWFLMTILVTHPFDSMDDLRPLAFMLPLCMRAGPCC